jgi:lysophospholipase L1-like esterase
MRYASIRLAALGVAILSILATSLEAQTPAPGTTQPATQPARRGGRGAGRGAGRGNPAPQVLIPRDEQPYTPNNFNAIKPNLPTLVIAGDSTADKGPDAWHRGWAAPLIDYFDTSKINVVNTSIGGRSFRSFTREGRWDRIVEALKPGDIVFIQMGHNDGGDVNSPNGRPDLPGTGDETREITRADGTKETVLTYGGYARKWVREAKAKGATPILMSTTVYNRWNNGKYARSGNNTNNLYNWMRIVAKEENVQFLDHNNIISDRYEQLGEDAVKQFFAADPLHTTTYGAIVNAELFVSGIKALNIEPLVNALNEKGKAIEPWKPSEAAVAGLNSPTTRPATRPPQ